MTQTEAKKAKLEYYLDKFGYVCHISTKVLYAVPDKTGLTSQEAPQQK